MFIDHDGRTVQRLRATKRLDLDEVLRHDDIKRHVSSTRVTLEPTGAQRELLGYTCDECRLADIHCVSKKRKRAPEPNAAEFSVDDGLLGDDEHLSIKRRSSSSARSVWPTPLSRRRR